MKREGYLRLTPGKVWEVIWYEDEDDTGAYDLHSGDCVELCIGGVWIPTVIEHDGKEYYSTTGGTILINGLKVRL